jgi:hypothetical protein
MNEVTRKDIAELFADGTVIDRALKQATQEALLLHCQRGVPIAVWRNSQVIWIPPDEIPRSEGGGTCFPAA